ASRRVAKTAGNPQAGRSTTPTSQRLHVGRDALPHGRIRHRAGGGREVLTHVIDAGGRWNCDGDGRVSEEELPDELRPARQPEFARPFGQRLTLEAVGQRALPERPVDDDGNAAL